MCYVKLLQDEYAGRDEESGEARERQVAVEFTAFGAKAKALAEHVYVGDQLFVQYRVANNNRDLGNGQVEYGFSFILENFEFGAPGQLKREKLAERG